MKLRLLKSFYPETFRVRLDKKNEVIATNRNGAPYKESKDFIIEEQDKPGLEVIRATNFRSE